MMIYSQTVQHTHRCCSFQRHIMGGEQEEGQVSIVTHFLQRYPEIPVSQVRYIINLWLKTSTWNIQRVILEAVWALLVIWVEVTVMFLLKLPLECGICRYQAPFGMLFLETGPVLLSAKCLQFSGTVFPSFDVVWLFSIGNPLWGFGGFGEVQYYSIPPQRTPWSGVRLWLTRAPRGEKKQRLQQCQCLADVPRGVDSDIN